MQNDSIKASIVWGRIGGAVLCLVGVGLSAFGVELGTEEQKAIFDHIDKLLITGGALMAIGSKVREKMREGKK